MNYNDRMNFENIQTMHKRATPERLMLNKCALNAYKLHHGSSESMKRIVLNNYCVCLFVELGGGVDDVLVWCREGAYVEFGFR